MHQGRGAWEAMSLTDFTVIIDDWHATATHRSSGHVFEFALSPSAPHCRSGEVRENPSADRGPDGLWGVAQRAVLAEARALGLIPQ
jgi:hypothetical protein